MIISHKYQFIFIKTRKTAGTSIEAYLSQYCGDKDVVTPIHPALDIHKPRNYDEFYNHIGAASVRDQVEPEIWDKYFKFCVERNPWDKTLSHYHMMNTISGGKLSLEDYFLSGDYCIDFPAYVEPEEPSHIILDKVLKFENIDTELGLVFNNLGVPFNGALGIKAKSEYRTDKRSYKDVLTGEQAELISNAFVNERTLFGYSY